MQAANDPMAFEKETRRDIVQATLANTLSQTERDGHIRRTRHPSDARAQQNRPTAAAKSIRRSAYDAVLSQNQHILSDLSVTGQKEFIGFMNRVITSSQRKQDDDETQILPSLSAPFRT